MMHIIRDRIDYGREADPKPKGLGVCPHCGGPWEENPQITLISKQKIAYVGARRIDLTAMQTKILKAFLDSPDQRCTREQLERDIYGRVGSRSERALDMVLFNFRERLAGSRATIRNIRGWGWEFMVT